MEFRERMENVDRVVKVLKMVLRARTTDMCYHKINCINGTDSMK